MFSVRSQKKALFFIVFFSLIALVGCTSEPNRFGIIFVLRKETGSTDIYKMPDNTLGEIEPLTFTSTINEYALLASKDGNKVVFTTDFYFSLDEIDASDLAIEKPRHIYLLDTTSKKLTDITNILVEYETIWNRFSMDWLPDQKQFVVLKDEVIDSEIKDFLDLMDFEGTNKKKIPVSTVGEIPSVIQSVKWSPSGEKFLLTQGVMLEYQLQNPGSAILVYDLKTGSTTQITDYQDHCLPREWSPTSRQIVVTCSFYAPTIEGISGPSAVRILDVENPAQPYERIGFSPCYDPSWSLDGKQIAFVCDKKNDQVGLFIVNSDGDKIREVKLGDAKNLAVLKNPAWSPDNTKIIYVAGIDSGHMNIYSVELDGSNNHPLTDHEAYYDLIAVYPAP